MSQVNWLNRVMPGKRRAAILLVANERSDSLVAFAIDAETGDLTRIATRPSLSPCTIAFL